MAEVLNKLNQSTPTSLDDITLGLENEDESSDWVKDVMAILIDEVLNVNSTLGGAVMEDLRADLAQLAHDLGEDIGDNLETASELIMDSAASFVTHARFYFAGLGTSVSGLYSWIKGWSCWSLLCDQAGDDLLSGPASGETTKARVSVYKKLMMITLVRELFSVLNGFFLIKRC